MSLVAWLLLGNLIIGAILAAILFPWFYGSTYESTWKRYLREVSLVVWSNKMPVAVVTNNFSEKIMLTTLPEGYVVVRRMSYGEELERSQLATKFTMGASAGTKDFAGEMDIQTEKVALWDFAHLIVEHNLTDENETLLNFKNAKDVNRLDNVVGKEIGEIIDNFNAAKDSEEVKNSLES